MVMSMVCHVCVFIYHVRTYKPHVNNFPACYEGKRYVRKTYVTPDARSRAFTLWYYYMVYLYSLVCFVSQIIRLVDVSIHFVECYFVAFIIALYVHDAIILETKIFFYIIFNLSTIKS